MLFAAAHPERTRALVLQGAEVRERTDDDWPWGETTAEPFEAAMQTVEERWGQGRAFQYLLPSIGDVDWGREWVGGLQRNAGTPGSWKAFARMAFDIDVRHIVPSIAVPTLIFHAVGDLVCHVENARYLARTIPGARYIEVDGADHLPWAADQDRFISEVRSFLTGEHASPVTDRVLATFDGPARAIRCAQAIQRGTAPLGLDVRAGVHTGEIEKLGDGVAGIAVHIGARVAAAAGPGEVWVSATVPLLTAGSGIAYEDRGVRQLKGVPDEQHLYAVA